MASRFRTVLAPVACFACVCALLPTSTAQAYCRTHVDDPAQSSCPPVCTNAGAPLAWHSGELSYAFNTRGFPGVDDAKLRSIFAASFAAWEDVRCDDEPIGITMTQLAETSTLEEGPMKEEPNQNVITHYDAAAWAAKSYSRHAFAVTAVWFQTDGQIVGSDIGFNGGMDTYGDCAVDQCTRTGIVTDLQNVATHEIGHFFGLSHSAVKGSTMSCDAAASDTDKRSLEQDDVDGICLVYPPGESFPDDHPERSRQSGKCALTPAGLTSSTPLLDLSVLGALAGLLGLRRRRIKSARG